MQICGIFNIAPLYRQPIYSLMDKELGIDFVFGDQPSENIALMNPENLNGFRGYARNMFKGSKLVWQRGAIRKAFSRHYKAYILTGNTGILSNWVIILIAKLLGRKTYLWTHSLSGSEKGITLFKNRLYLKLADGLLCYNERGAQNAISHGINKKKVHIIYNSLDYDLHQKIKERTPSPEFIKNYFGSTAPYICYIGRLTAIKKIDQILRAAKNDSSYNIILVGDGPEMSNLQALTEELGLLDRVWFYGECYDQTMIAAILTHCAAAISPGNAGLNAIHALTFGTPLITSDNLDTQMPEAEAIMELQTISKTTLLYPNNDIDKLAQTIQEIISITPEQRKNISIMAQEIIAKKWNPHTQINTLHQILGI